MLQTPSITLAVEAGLSIAPDGFDLPNGNQKRQLMRQ
jgi:predicted metallo-beta-lactamase superfamily hydrolase